MLRVTTKNTSFCDGTTRRDLLRVGGLGALGLWGVNPDNSVAAAKNRFGQAKAVIFVTLYGGPPQTETWDMKPKAPVEARGPFKTIRSSVVDLHVCEHLPRLAKLAHMYTLVRSFSHTDTAHGAGIYTHLTGWPHRINNQNFPAHPDDHPHYGAIVSKLRPPTKSVPACAVVGGKILPQFKGIGQTGGYLGKVHAPFFYDGNNGGRYKDSRLGSVRVNRRLRLVDQLQERQRLLDKNQKVKNFSVVQRRAVKLLGSKDFVPAFDLRKESAKTRDAYGRHPLGQNVLLARRLVEAGVPVVQISDIPVGGEQHWDLHYANIFSRLRQTLLPRLDQSVSALLMDLKQRGMLDSTLVIVGGEFGCSPYIDHLSNPAQGGRQHWPHCYSMMFAGGGIRSGEVFGRSDALAAYPAAKKVAPWDMGATLLHLMGIDPTQQVTDRDGRTRRLTKGSAINGIIA